MRIYCGLGKFSAGDKKDQVFLSLYGVETKVFNQAVKRNRNKGVLPYAFTEHGVSMLASVLRSEKAVGQRNWEDRERIGFKPK